MFGTKKLVGLLYQKDGRMIKRFLCSIGLHWIKITYPKEHFLHMKKTCVWCGSTSYQSYSQDHNM